MDDAETLAVRIITVVTAGGSVQGVAGMITAWQEATQLAALPGETMSRDDALEAQTQFDQGKACVQCGGLHLRACPRVKRIVFHGGEPQEIEFWPHGQWPTDDVVWPEACYAVLGEDGGAP